MKVVIAGTPRCGTTYLFRSLAGLEQSEFTPKRYEGDLIKVHGPAPKDLPPEYRAIFMYGDVVRAVISTKKKRWTREHFRNCGCRKWFPKIYERDDLNYELMFDTWTRDNGYPVLALRYETMHEHIDVISDFVGERVRLLPWIARTTSYEEVAAEVLRTIRTTYESLIAKVAAMPAYQLIPDSA